MATDAHTPEGSADDPGSGGGLIIIAGAVVALIWVNLPFGGSYGRFWHHHLDISALHMHLSLQHWVNDGLMTAFFLLVGLEIRHELAAGHLKGRRAATLPVVAAIGGMVVPAVVYLAVAGRSASHGWGIPMATDIALAVSVLALVGSGIPPALRAFLLGLAVVDDIGAIVVIAVFYSQGVAWGWLALALAAIATTVAARSAGVSFTFVYVVLGAVLWYSLFRGGVHPTIAGVVMGLLCPVDRIRSVEHRVHGVTNWVIVPVFAIANSGIAVGAHALREAVSAPVAWGVFLGLVLGKPVGVLLATRLAVRSGVASIPADTSSRQLLGAGGAAGIGFTVALFVADLAFRHGAAVDEQLVADAKVAILLASVVSGAMAFTVLRLSRR
jgi:NhaA family Na+:H+ antiporter